MSRSVSLLLFLSFFFFFNDTPTTEIYTLSLHDALPIWRPAFRRPADGRDRAARRRHRRDEDRRGQDVRRGAGARSEEHTSELQSLRHLVCRLLLEKKKKKIQEKQKQKKNTNSIE